MIRNYFLIALRNFWRNRLVSLFNLLGMALGFGIFLSLWSLARFDMGFDRFHEDLDQMYVLHVRLQMENSEYISERTGGIFGRVLKENFPQVLDACRVSEALEFELGVPDPSDTAASMRFIPEEEVLAVDSTFVGFFSFPVLQGNPETMLREKDHIVLTRSLAENLFGEEDPMDREIQLGGAGYFRIAGVVEDPPLQSTYQFNALVGFHVLALRGYPLEGTGGTMYYNNFKVDEAADLDALNEAVMEYIDGNYDVELDARFYLDHLTRVHLHGESRSMQGVLIMMVMAVVILLIAMINYVNLSTAYSAKRFREIAIRKIVGAGKRQLMMQFLGETFLLLLLAMYLGFFLAETLLPHVSTAVDEGIGLELDSWRFWLQVLGIYLLTGFLSGLYPASRIAGIGLPGYFRRFRGSNPRSKAVSRKVLIVVQFTFSIAFIITSVLMMKQFEFLRKADLGFNREEVLYIQTRGQVWNHFQTLKSDLQDLHYVRGVSTGSSIPVMINNGDIGWGDREGDHNKVAVIFRCDEDFLSTFEIDILQGRFFYPYGADSLNNEYVVINQAVADFLGWEDPVGHSFYLWDQDFTVLGVIENIDFFPFNIEVFQDRLMIMRYQSINPYVFVRTSGVLSTKELEGIESLFDKHNPGYAFDCDYVGNYSFELQDVADDMRAMSWVFSVTAVIISLMGVIGLSVFSNQVRTREIGIRKVMGAREDSVMRLLLKEFVGLMFISNLLGITLAFFLTRRLLQIFSYAIEMQAMVFILVMLGSHLVALGTVTVLGIRTMRSNPVESLRYE